jgi:hypothetical protein
VITHSSGIQTDILKNSDLSTGSYTDVLGFINETYLLYPPGLVESYSNSGYNILGHLVKEKSGQDYTEYIHQHVFAPLGMEHSGFFTDPMENRTRTYAGEQSLIEYGFRDIASGGIYTSIHDLAKYAQGLMDAYNGVNNTLAARETIREMFSLQTDDALVGSNKKGLGWFMFANDSLIAVTHAGDAAWGHALLCLVPEKHTAGMILINSAEGTNLKNDFSSAFISACGGSFADIAHPPIIDRIHEGTTGITLPVTLLQQYAGDYSQGFSYVNVYMEDEDLLISRNNKVYVLRAVTKNEFIPWEKSGQNTLAEKRNERYFILDTCGIHILVHKSENSETLLGHRLDPFDPSPFNERLGSYDNYGYQLLVGDTDFLGAELSVSGDRVLMLKLNTSDGPYSFVLNMISDEYAVTSGLGTGYGFTVRLTEDETYYIVDFAGLTFRKSKDSNTGEPEFYGSAKVFSLAENYPYPFR